MLVRRTTWVSALFLIVGAGAVASGSASSAPRKLPPPSFGRSIDIGLVSGVVIVKPVKGQAFKLTAQDRNIPVGSELDTRRGEVDLRSAPQVPTPSNKLQDAQFSGGAFTILQRRGQHGLTVMHLHPSIGARVCGTGSSASFAPRRVSPRVLGLLRAHDQHGHFRTRGRYSAATVRGTVWETVERCDGTLTIVQHGTVLVRDFRRHRTITLHAGQRYLAAAP